MRTHSTDDRFHIAFSTNLETSRLGVAADELTADMPDADQACHASEMLVRTVFDLLRDTRLEPIAERIAWGIVHSFHKVASDLDTQGDHAAAKVRDLVRIGDTGEIGTVELEDAQTLCRSLDEARDAVEVMRDNAAETFLAETGRPWSGPRGSHTSSKRTASIIDATAYLAARRQKKLDANCPTGPVVVFSGGQEWEDWQTLYDTLDAIRERIPNLLLATTAQPKGCDAIAAAWAARTGTKLVAFTLNRGLGNRAGFARNEQLVKLRPVEAIVCEGSGLQSHLARALKAAGVPSHLFRKQDQVRTTATPSQG